MTGSEHQDISILKKRGETVMERLRDEFSSIRTGRAVPAILDSIRVNSYGSKVPINHIAGITMEDPRTLRVVPWDKGQVHDIEQAIGDAGLGLSVNVSDVGVRVIFPELTDERRSTLLKLAKGKHEEARISLRQARDDIWKEKGQLVKMKSFDSKTKSRK